MTADPVKDPKRDRESDRESLLLRLAALISDGSEVDWDAVESAAADDAEREMIRRLKALAEITAVHRPPGSSAE